MAYNTCQSPTDRFVVTALTTDWTAMLAYHSPIHLQHDPGQLPQPAGASRSYYSEVPARAEIIRAALEESGLATLVAPHDRGREPLQAVHTHALLDLLQHGYDDLMRLYPNAADRPLAAVPETYAVRSSQAPPTTSSIWARLGWHCYDSSAPLFAGTWDAVYWSAQCALAAAAHVYDHAGVAYALCRPPGHHAGPNLYGGFCYVNNTAVAAQWLAVQHMRVAVIDIDYHHGNGTQDIFYQRNDVLTLSLHVDPDVDYPYYWGYAGETGAGYGTGYNMNLPLPRHTDEETYLDALQHAVDRVHAYAPDILIVAVGFDTYIDDPVGGFHLTTAAYPRIAERLASLHAPAIIIQEGGYARSALAANVTAFLAPFV